MKRKEAVRIVADDIVRCLIFDWANHGDIRPDWEDYPEIGEYDWNAICSEVASRAGERQDGPLHDAMHKLAERAEQP